MGEERDKQQNAVRRNWSVCTVAEVEGDTLLEKEQSVALYLFVLFTMYSVLCAAGNI